MLWSGQASQKNGYITFLAHMFSHVLRKGITILNVFVSADKGIFWTGSCIEGQDIEACLQGLIQHLSVRSRVQTRDAQPIWLAGNGRFNFLVLFIDIGLR